MRQRSRAVESRTAGEPTGASGTARSSRVPRVTVVGSLNTDISLAVPHLPGPGETVLSPAGADIGAGGKGANQAVAAARLGGAGLAGTTLRGPSVALVLPGLAGPPLAAATDRGAQPVGHVLRHGRRMALGLHPHGGQLGEQVLGGDPKLLGDLIYPRVAQPDLTSLSSLERGAGWPADPLHIRFRNSSTAALAATVSVTFRARWMLRRRTAMSRQTGCPHR